jgi:flagellar protein FliS
MAVNGYARSAQEYQRAQVNAASPTQLIVMLYDGAIRFLSQSVEHMSAGNIEQRHMSILKAQRIITELHASLKVDVGGDVAKNLARLYSYSLERTVEANLYDRIDPLKEVLGIFHELRESWIKLDEMSRTGATERMEALAA